jgi:hypothetical protein
MSIPPVPLKTPAGVDEIKHRGLRLSQRHRTVLVLVDGRRTLSQVLGLANQAGSATHHFEELLRLGLVELPREPEPPPPPETAPGALDVLRVHSLEVDVVSPQAPAAPNDEPELPELPELAVEFDLGDEAPAPIAPVLAVWAETTPVSEWPPETLPPPTDTWLAEVAPAATQFIEPAIEAVLPTAPVSARSEERIEPGFAPAPVTPPPDDAPPAPVTLRTPPAAPAVATPPRNEEQLLDHVRNLLAETLSFDSPLFSTRMLMRVRMTATRRELINLVWEIERHARHTRRPAEALRGLIEVRELLGMGNTQVSGESQYGWPEDEDA